MNAVAKLTTEFQATIPAPVRKVLQINPGDTVAFDIRDGVVTLRRAISADMTFPKAVDSALSEWNSEADDHAYRNL